MQIIGVEGHNPSGHCLVVTRLVDSIPINVHDGNFGAEVPHAKRQATDTSIPTSIDNSSSNLPMSVVCWINFMFLIFLTISSCYNMLPVLTWSG